MFFDKRAVIAMHAQELEAWEGLLAGLSIAQITTPSLPNGWSVKDTVAHLAAWQQRTVARLEAALDDRAPRFPRWPVELGDEESDEAVDRANAWLLETNRDRLWPDVHGAWREGYLRFLELLRAVPESEMRADGKVPWVAEYELLDGQAGPYDYHHARHRGTLEAWIREHARAAQPR
jgi:hypothetical protein